ncbi:hypothetical protein CXB51_020214 [Gossypium anomalum]|uniref:RNase H type-1 domain-containing protein n=1 Tax=Gossypium anomalum TaxID=47600 RepID=A0A8J5YKN6_9ROSI|nr:hypothetical protein CXB51_020214 [Gossypium anomalum]
MGVSSSILVVLKFIKKTTRQWDAQRLTSVLDRKLHVTWPSTLSNISFQDWLLYVLTMQTGFVSQSMFYLLEFDVVHAKLPRRLIRIERWQPPEGSYLKVNFDATFYAPTILSCVRIVVMDNLGFVVGSKSVVNTHMASAFVAEALACYHVVQLGLNLGLQEVIFVGNSPIVIRKLYSPHLDESVIGPYIRDVKGLVGQFRLYQFFHISSQGNTVARLLDSKGLHGEGCAFQRRILDFARRASCVGASTSLL